MKTVEIKSSELRDRIDSIHGCIIAYSRAYNDKRFSELDKIQGDIIRKIENLCGLLKVDYNAFSSASFSMIAQIRTGRFTTEKETKEKKISVLSPAGFRKFVKEEILRDKYGLEFVSPVKPKMVKDDNGNMRPMTEAEKEQARLNKIAYLEKQLAKLKA